MFCAYGDEQTRAPALWVFAVWGDRLTPGQSETEDRVRRCVRWVCEVKNVTGRVGGEQVWCERVWASCPELALRLREACWGHQGSLEEDDSPRGAEAP